MDLRRAPPDGGFTHVGGGDYDPATDTWGQGAFNADDVSRAAVVYLRHWQATGVDGQPGRGVRDAARPDLPADRGGPNAGNVVLWMQPDGTLNRSAEPAELPDPSDSDASYWVARTIWALGEGYAAFEKSDPAFARFLGDRLELSVGAVDRQVLDQYGKHLDIDGQPAPAWLIFDGADASGEAVLGLSAYVAAGGSATARRVLSQLSQGIAELRGGDARQLADGSGPALGGVPLAVARLGLAMPRPRWPTPRACPRRPGARRRGAERLVHVRPVAADLGRAGQRPAADPGRPTQIAYGADSRVQSLLATADAARDYRCRDRPRRDRGGVVLRRQPRRRADVRPGHRPDLRRHLQLGVVNHNSGAESTIHGLLSMIALDAHPASPTSPGPTRITSRLGTLTLEAEDGTLTGDATAHGAAVAWTGEALFSGTGYAALGAGGSATLTLPAHPRSLVLPVFDSGPGAARSPRSARTGSAGRVASGDIGAQGDSPAPGALLPVTVPGTLPAGADRLSASTATGAGDPPRWTR